MNESSQQKGANNVGAGKGKFRLEDTTFAQTEVEALTRKQRRNYHECWEWLAQRWLPFRLPGLVGKPRGCERESVGYLLARHVSPRPGDSKHDLGISLVLSLVLLSGVYINME